MSGPVFRAPCCVAGISDKMFQGRRAPAGILFMVLVTLAVLVYWFNPAGNPTIDMMALVAIGFLIYGPVMLIGLYALELAPKKAAGTAAGFTGLFGYLGGAVAANAMLGYTVDHFGWDGGFMVLTAVLRALYHPAGDDPQAREHCRCGQRSGCR